MFRPVAGSVPLGLFGLAAASLVLAGLQLGWVDSAESDNVGIALIAFGFGAQLVASLFAFLARDSGVASALGVLAFNWLVVGLVLATNPAGSTSDALGLFLLVAATAVALSGINAAASKAVPALVFVLAGLRIGTSGIHQLTAAEAWQDIAGVLGVVLCIAAIYTAFAAEVEGSRKRTVLPLGRRGLDVAQEPGVREEL